MQAADIFESNEVLPELMNNIFRFVEKQATRLQTKLTSHHKLERKGDHTVYHGSESISSFAPKLWDLLPNSIKDSASLK